MKKYYLIALILSVSLTACNSIPKDALKLSPTSLKDRQMETRKFDTGNEDKLLAAGIGVLQDMGYSIDSSQQKIGLVTASKMASAVNAAQVALAFLAALGGNSTAIDTKQKIRVTLVTIPTSDKKHFLARITFQRIVWNSRGQVTHAQTLTDKKLYQGFFNKLSESVFLEAHQI